MYSNIEIVFASVYAAKCKRLVDGGGGSYKNIIKLWMQGGG